MTNFKCRVMDGEKTRIVIIQSKNELTAKRQLNNQGYGVLEISRVR